MARKSNLTMLVLIGTAILLLGCSPAPDSFGSRPLRVREAEYAVQPKEIEFRESFVRPLPYEQLLDRVRGIAEPVDTRTCRYDTGSPHVA